MIDKAFILAAGLGTRMRPLTDSTPKPLLEVAGRTLIDHALDKLEKAGVNDVTVNLHYLGGQIRTHLGKRKSPALHFSEEPQLLDTGGGIQKTLPHFGDDPFYVISGDSLWQDAPGTDTLKSLAAAWDPAKMDIMILLQDIRTMRLTEGVGDYHLEPDGRAVRAYDRRGTHMFTSIRINAPRIFTSKPENLPFSYLDLLDQAQKRGRLFGLEHRGQWHHLSTPADIAAVNEHFAKTGGAA